METFVYTLHFLVCLVLIGVVLLQRGKGADLGASLGGGSANTIFGSRGAGNFLTRITTASAIIFMGTSLALAYLGYQGSDVQLFDTEEPFEVPAGGLVPAPEETGGLEEIPADAGGSLEEIPADAGGGLVEIQTDEDAAPAGTATADPAAAGGSEGDAP